MTFCRHDSLTIKSRFLGLRSRIIARMTRRDGSIYQRDESSEYHFVLFSLGMVRTSSWSEGASLRRTMRTQRSGRWRSAWRWVRLRELWRDSLRQTRETFATSTSTSLGIDCVTMVQFFSWTKVPRAGDVHASKRV